ncbi:MAG: LPXTG cell wall anchor domain-containing protein, partial [Actinobacteria bacterium]|nr:LPXTG cell wall anchor domain-containing protein [Actinomycetota bacterium]
DGNNGCGNDDDFEDDNEGWCGKPPRDDADATTPTTSTSVPGGSRQGDVRGTDAEVTPAPAAVDEDHELTPAVPVADLPEEAPVEDDVETGVLGVTFTREPAGEVLAAGAADGPELAAAAVAGIAAAGELPRTGAGLAGLAAVGLSALAGGTALSRRRG